MAGKRITESVEEVDLLLDDMAILQKQMQEGGKLVTDEEMEQKAKKAVEEAGMEVVEIPETTIDDWINGTETEQPAEEQNEEQPEDEGDQTEG